MLLLLLMLLATVIRLCLLFFYSSRPCVDVSSQFMLRCSLSLILDTPSMSSLWYKVLLIVISFLVLESICLCSSLVRFKNGQEYLTRGPTFGLILWWNFCWRAWFQEVFWWFRGTNFLFLLSSLFVWWFPFSLFRVLIILLFSERFFFLSLAVTFRLFFLLFPLFIIIMRYF